MPFFIASVKTPPDRRTYGRIIVEILKATKPRRGIKLPKAIRIKQNGKYIAEPSFKGLRESETCDSLEEALEAKDRILERLKTQFQESQGLADTWTLKEAFDWTWTLRWKAQKVSVVKIGYPTVERFFKPDTLLTKITTERVDEFIKFMVDKGDADSTINRKLSCLSTILNTAKDRGKLTMLPRLTRRKEREGRIRFLTEEEEKTLLNWLLHLGKPDHYEACVVLVDTGFRTGELWSVTASSVSLDQGTITLWVTKADKPRTIPMTKRVYEIVARRCQEYPHGPLFPAADNDWLHRQWQRVRKCMNLLKDDQFVPHALRHTCCSRLVQRGVPLLHVQQWMGHKSIQTTMRYAHLAPHDLFSLAQVLDGGTYARWQGANIASPLPLPDERSSIVGMDSRNTVFARQQGQVR